MSDRDERLRALMATVPVRRAEGPHPSGPGGAGAGRDGRVGDEVWSRAALSGRLTELSGSGPVASLTSVFGLILDAQTRSEPVAWITLPGSCFYPPDAAESGVDLDALVVVCVPDVSAAGRAAEQLLRSGGFGLIALDLGASARLPAALQGRLVSLAKHHDTALVCLTDKARESASLGALVSLRAEAVRASHGDDFCYQIEVLKDKRRGPGWTHREVVRGPAGLR